MINPIIIYPYDYCFKCKSKSIEIYSWHNYPQKYSKVLETFNRTGKLPDSLNKYGIFTMRCSKCGKEYKISWEDGFPKPIHDDFDINIFMNKFRQDSLDGKPKITTNIYKERMKKL